MSSFCSTCSLAQTDWGVCFVCQGRPLPFATVEAVAPGRHSAGQFRRAPFKCFDLFRQVKAHRGKSGQARKRAPNRKLKHICGAYVVGYPRATKIGKRCFCLFVLLTAHFLGGSKLIRFLHFTVCAAIRWNPLRTLERPTFH